MSAKHRLGTPLAILLAGSLLSTGAAAMPAASRQGAASGASHAALALQTPAAVTTLAATVTGTAATATTTAPPTATSSATASPTTTSTSSPTATATATNSATASPTATRTATPLPTATRTATPRPTATRTPAPIMARFSVTPATAAPGSVIIVSGGNFAASERISISLSGARSGVATLQADRYGNLYRTSVTVPYNAVAGAQTLTARGLSSRRTAAAPLTIIAVYATLAVTPAVTNRGGVITISGGSYAPNEKLTVTIDGFAASLATITATVTGAITPTGVSIPYTLPDGPHLLRVSGAVSGRTATAAITVAALAPSIGLSLPIANPGTTITVTGRSFGRQERVTLALNGAALVTSPAVITTTNGLFTASFVVPASVLRGPNTVSAIGNTSRVSAVATLTGVLAVASSFYFAGASTLNGEAATLPILNPNAQPTHIDFTFYYGASMTGTATLDVPAHSRGTADLNALAGAGRVFGVKMVADRVVQAQLREARAGRDDFGLLGVSAPSTTWYLAEGYTGLTFHETVSILNPGATVAAVRLRLLPFGGRAARVVTLDVAPQSIQEVDVNRLLPNQSLSVIADASAPVVVERTLTFSNDGFGVTAQAGINTAATSWIFAEGTTTTRFQTFFTILNPNAVSSLVTATFYDPRGEPLDSRTILVPGLSRANIKLNDVLRASGIATVVTANLPVVVERPEYFGSPNVPYVAGSDVFGRNGAGLSWAFPGGTTTNRREFLLIYNPSAKTVSINATFYGSDGSVVTRSFAVPPTVRYNLDIDRLLPGLMPEHSIVLSAANGVGFVAEQTVFAPDFSALDSTQGFAQ